MSRRRLLVLIKSLGGGGAERLLVDSLTHGDRSRYDYRVAYLLRDSRMHVSALERSGFPVICLGGAPRGLWPVRLRRLVRTHGIELIHAHSPVMAVGARLAARVPLVYTEHNVWQSYHPLTRLANRASFGRNAHAFAVSDEVRSSISRPTSSGPVETLRYGVDLGIVEAWRRSPVDPRPEFGVPKGAPAIVTVANLRPAKGHSTLISAAERVRRSIPDARFILVGDGHLREQLAGHARQLGLEDAVIFAGFRKDAGQLVAGADLFVLPSVFDGLSIALVEAMALGRAVAITGVGGNVEVVRHGREGLVVPPGDPGALANAIVRLLQDGDLRAQLSEAAARRAQSLDIRSAVRRHEAVYAALLDHGSA